MVLLCKQKALYVKACIIANGVTDSQGDTLYREDIKKIFTSFNNQDNFEVYHNDIPIQEVSLLENYISQTDETIGTAVVPSGSWNAVIRVDNPEVQSALLTGEFRGVSLNNRIAEPCKGNLTGQVRYSDIRDAECIIPLLISFVESAANGYGLHVMDYDAYIKKSDAITKSKGAHIMDLNEFMEGLKSLIKQAEDTPVEEPAVEKEDEETEEEIEPVEEEATVEKEDEEEETSTEEEEAPTEEETETVEAEETEEEAEITKEEEGEPDLEARIAKLEELIQQLLPEEAEAEEEEVIDEDTPKITKSEKVIVEDKTQKNVNYYEMTNRDPLTGMKIRNQSKIL